MAIGRANKRKAPVASVRRSQTISTYGIGSLIPVASESFIMMGQDSWPPKWINDPDNWIIENSFARALGKAHFVLPPDGDYFPLPVRRFPEWASCSKCRKLAPWYFLAAQNMNGEKINTCRFCSAEDANLVTSRFVAACAAGHIRDFPYFPWVHNDFSSEISFQDDEKHSLSLHVNPKDDSLRGMTVKCTCGQERTLEGALGRGTLALLCKGETPWLAEGSNNDCGERLVGLQRGATRVWQAETRSTISIDKAASPLEEEVTKNLEKLKNFSPELLLQVIPGFFPNEDPDKVLQIFQSLTKENDTSEQMSLALGLRQEEYDALQSDRPETFNHQTFVCYPQILEEDECEFTKISLTSQVPRMKEVRALVGFSRVDQSEDSKKHPPLSSNSNENWVPAIEAFGEGLFVRLDPKAVSKWENSAFAQDRAHQINYPAGQLGDNPLVTPRRLLLHSLSHALLNELALNTGYPASSISERVYDYADQCGILLYTATSDAAGSLGGLCAQGSSENLIKILGNAIQHARWCSADPVCIESSVHGVNNSNLAACHYCMLAPEVSCEHQNLHLDRACLVGTPDSPEAGFFSHLIV